MKIMDGIKEKINCCLMKLLKDIRIQRMSFKMSKRYETTKSYIIDCLIGDYMVSPKDAEEAVEKSKINNLFKQNGDLAAHTSNEDYAKQIYNAFLKAKT